MQYPLSSRMEELRAAVKAGESVNAVKALVLKITDTKTMEQEDTYGLSLLHYAILKLDEEIVNLLLTMGYFVPPHMPNKISYLHLACTVGKALLVGLLLRDRPGDLQQQVSSASWQDSVSRILTALADQEWKPSSVDHLIKLTHTSIEHASDFPMQVTEQGNGLNLPITSQTSIVGEIQTSDKEQLLLQAVDIAAIAGHVKCVFLLLNSHGSYVEKAVMLRSPMALSVVFESSPEAVPECELNDAFKEALRHKLSLCLDLILSYKLTQIQPYQVFNGLNPYYVMYMCTSGFQVHGHDSNRFMGLAECTSVLIRHSLNVNCKKVLGAYPLYSLIHSLIQEKDFHPSQVPVHHMECLQLLLEAGADPNFNEVQQSNSMMDDESHFPPIGRELYTSALNALFNALHASDCWQGFDASFVADCCKQLCEYGANPNHIDSYGNTPMEDLMNCLAMQHSMGHISLNLWVVIGALLSYGADPNLKSSNGFYPINHYFTMLLTLMRGHNAFHLWSLHPEAAGQVLQLLHFMDHTRALSAAAYIMLDFAKTPQYLGHENLAVVPEPVIEYMKGQLGKHLKEAKSLRSLTQLAIWKHVKRDRNKVKDLPLPKSLHASIVAMVEDGL